MSGAPQAEQSQAARGINGLPLSRGIGRAKTCPVGTAELREFLAAWYQRRRVVLCLTKLGVRVTPEVAVRAHALPALPLGIEMPSVAWCLRRV